MAERRRQHARLRSAILAGIAAAGLSGGAMAQAAPPRSAIDWLSDTVRAPAPQETTPAPPPAAGPSQARPAGVAAPAMTDPAAGGVYDGVRFLPENADEAPIESAPIGPARKDGVGLVAAVQAGLPAGFWAGAPRAASSRRSGSAAAAP